MFDLQTIIAMNTKKPFRSFCLKCKAEVPDPSQPCTGCDSAADMVDEPKPTAKPRPVSVGRNDCAGKVFHFSTIADAEEAVALLENGIPWDVATGGYYIDAPEDMVNPR